MTAQTLRICMLNADVPVPAVANTRAPTYGRIFHHLLLSAATTLKITPSITITSTDFDVTRNEYPTSLSEFDAIVISGSASSAYDDLPWIRKLTTWVRSAYACHPRVKIFGSCFGHQLVCHALLGAYGVKVEKDGKGWELGVKEITLHDRFRKTFGKGLEGQKEVVDALRLQFVHHDHVVIPEMDALPASWMTVGNTWHCAVQGVYEGGRVFTLQGHFEFDRFVNSETIKFFFPTWQPKVLEETLEMIDADDDSVVAATMVLEFFLNDVEQKTATYAVAGGLLTPPLRE
ncbi:class I glutamine amidotransferase-like protein [Decorospora gaudefroyi]|uniref:Class I glutamine amidotransferase-like protein n=1 Tax=Decorospora gaudefroyi TaxID=184978 RepID=A0A6A5KEE4_9PLEO|nr:class I glutamine amidotransferase-like protein [Decorospora gaudefroyi]